MYALSLCVTHEHFVSICYTKQHIVSMVIIYVSINSLFVCCLSGLYIYIYIVFVK